MNKKISDLRRDYIKGGLVEANLPKDPVKLFKEWFNTALETEVSEPNAMSLATVNREGHPSVRIVLLKGIEKTGIQFFTNYKSDKAADLENMAYASCCLWWAELERQIRINGPTTKLPERMNIEYFKSRPRESQIGAWASNQSSLVEGREELIHLFNKFEKKFEGKEIPKPPHWGGFQIEINSIEFWQGRAGRMHDRIVYSKESDDWKMCRLAP